MKLFELINQDIEDSLGFEGWACHCPIARCISRVLGYKLESEFCVIGTDDADIFYLGNWVEIKLPAEVIAFVKAFDKAQDVQSFSFELELPC